MEKQDLELIEQLMDRDPELKLYVEKHREYERQLETFNRRPYLTTAETMLSGNYAVLGPPRHRSPRVAHRTRTTLMQGTPMLNGITAPTRNLALLPAARATTP